VAGGREGAGGIGVAGHRHNSYQSNGNRSHGIVGWRNEMEWKRNPFTKL